jgi:glycosyltransferase involved in cell wall biosynthesis
MFWPPNIEGTLWFAWEVFPQVLEQVPRAQFVVVGKDPPREVRTLPMHVRNVEVTGYVPDPKPYLAETAVFIVPLKAGGGMRVKIVDAWCWGVPIVSTSIGAEGIAVEDGCNILIADTPAAMAEAVARVLDERALGERLRENGRQWVKQRYDWRQVYSRWNQVYEKLIATA